MQAYVVFFDTAEAFQLARVPEGSRRQTCEEGSGMKGKTLILTVMSGKASLCYF